MMLDGFDERGLAESRRCALAHSSRWRARRARDRLVAQTDGSVLVQLVLGLYQRASERCVFMPSLHDRAIAFQCRSCHDVAPGWG